MKHSMAKVLGAAFLIAAIASTGVYAQSGTITADMLNVRTGPSTSAEIVDALYYGDTVNITYNAGDWCEIYRNGDCYYINAHCKTLSVDTPKDRVQVERYMIEHGMAE